MKIFYAITFLVFTAIACEKDVKLDLKNDHDLIVDGLITDSLGYNYIKLYSLQDYYSNAAPDSISGALVTVTDNWGNGSVFSEKLNTHGYYCNNEFQGVVGEIYKLQIQYNGKTYESSAKLPPTLRKIDIKFEAKRKLLIIRDSTTKEDTNYYRLCLFVNNSLLDSLQWLLLIAGQNSSKAMVYDVFLTQCHESDTIKVEEQSLTQEAYLYYTNLKTYMQYQEEPFQVPPVFPTGNISNGGLGMFRCSSVKTVKAKF